MYFPFSFTAWMKTKKVLSPIVFTIPMYVSLSGAVALKVTAPN